jgi:hypothetical protein
MNGIERLKFYEEDHIYEYEGSLVPSVTTILQPYSGLEFVDKERLEVAAQFGTNVHTACHLWNIGQLDYDALSCDEDNQALKAYVDGWIKFCEESGYTIIQSEVMIYHEKLRYAGTLDNIGCFPKSKRNVLIDIKTGSSIPHTVGPQTAAYNEAIGERLQRHCCQLIPGGYKLIPLRDPNDFSIFKAALTLHNWLSRK